MIDDRKHFSKEIQEVNIEVSEEVEKKYKQKCEEMGLKYIPLNKKKKPFSVLGDIYEKFNT